MTRWEKKGSRAARLKALGNAVVPQCATLVALAINDIDGGHEKAIAAFDLRQTCRARLERRPDPCATVTGAWERERCRREVRP